ncbi:MAG: response regulator transcription factor [Cyanobacteria bacterium]|nr:response regulator transcription factor [Cyanobacteriota bacterium]
MRAGSSTSTVVDLSMPRVNGLTLIRQLRYVNARTKVIVFSRYREVGYVRDAFAAGARGYVLKQSSFEELRKAIDAVMRGEHHLDAAQGPPLLPPGIGPLLSDRELDVLRRSALGHANQEIADSLTIALKTVEAHKSHAMKKLGLGSRRDVIRYAALQGWFDNV